MTRTFAVNELNDLFVDPTTGNLVIADSLSAVITSCKQASQAQLTEMVLAVNQGMPAFQTVWTDAGSVPQYEAALRATLSQQPQVLEVVSVDVVIENNMLTYSATIRTTYGEAIING